MDTPTNSTNAKDPESFVREELTQAQLAFKRTRIFGSIVFLALSIETIAVCGNFARALQPHEAAIIASGFVMTQLDQHSDQLKQSLVERVPAMIEQSPDYAIQQLPAYKEALEAKVTDSLTSYTRNTAQALGDHLDAYIEANKTEIGTVLASSTDPKAAEALGPGLHAVLASYLNEKAPGQTESVREQIDSSLTMLKDVKTKMDHLANGSDLSPSDKLTRHAVAVLASSVTKENLQPLPIKEAIPTMTANADTLH